MAPTSPALEQAVFAVLRQVREAQASRPTRTALFKFVYLLDCLHAEQHGGRTSSGARWYFHHFGPYAGDLADAIDRMASVGMIQSQDGETRDKEYTQFWLGEFPLGPSLSEVGLSGGAAGRFQQWIRKFSGDLPRLLDHAYFKTEPMLQAAPGDTLDFSLLQEQLAPRPARINDQGVLFEALKLAHELASGYSERRSASAALAAHDSIYDGEFERAMADDAESSPGRINFSAQLI